MQTILYIYNFYILAVSHRREFATGYRVDFGKGFVAIENQTLQNVQDNMQLLVAGEHRATSEEKCCCEKMKHDSNYTSFVKTCEENEGLSLQSDEGVVCCKKFTLVRRWWGLRSATCTANQKFTLSMTKVRNPTGDFWSNIWTKDAYPKVFMRQVPQEPVFMRQGRQPPSPQDQIKKEAVAAMSGKEVGPPFPNPSVSFSSTDCSVRISEGVTHPWIDVGAPYRYKIPAILAASVSALRGRSEFPDETGYFRLSPSSAVKDLKTKIATGKIRLKDYDLQGKGLDAALRIIAVLKDQFRSLPKKLLDFVPIPDVTAAKNLELSGKSIVSLQMQPEETVKAIVEGHGCTMLENTPEPFRTTVKYWFDFLKQIVNGKNEDSFTSVVLAILTNMEVLLSNSPDIFTSPAFAKYTMDLDGVLVPKKGMTITADELKEAQKLLAQSGKNKKIIVCELWKAHFCSLAEDFPSCVSALVGKECDVE